jgi:hypothetical protein
MTDKNYCLIQKAIITFCLDEDLFFLPMVVMTVPAKNIDCPKLQFGFELVTFLTADIPLFVARTIFTINSSSSASEEYRQDIKNKQY